MKKILFVLAALLMVVAGLAHNHSTEGCECHSHAVSSEAPQEYVQVRCPVCNGYKIIMVGVDAWGNPVHAMCKNCGGTGVVLVKNPSFKGRAPYYAECAKSKCKCKFFVPERSGSTTCTCGHSMFDHVKRYN